MSNTEYILVNTILIRPHYLFFSPSLYYILSWYKDSQITYGTFFISKSQMIAWCIHFWGTKDQLLIAYWLFGFRNISWKAVRLNI